MQLLKKRLCLQNSCSDSSSLESRAFATRCFTTATKATAGSVRLPRGRKVPPLVPESAAIHQLQLQTLPTVNSKRCLMAAVQSLPAGTKFLSVLCKRGDSVDEPKQFLCNFGIYHSKEEFAHKASQYVAKGPLWVTKQRGAILKRWIGLEHLEKNWGPVNASCMNIWKKEWRKFSQRSASCCCRG